MGVISFIADSRTTTVLAVVLLANALFMMFKPPLWWSLVPGITESGPLNHHFVRDVAIAFACTSIGLLWSLHGGTWRVALLGSLFVVLHSLLHVIETIGGLHRNVILEEIALVHLPAWLALTSALAQRAKEQK
jgi:hypothetical protein